MKNDNKKINWKKLIDKEITNELRSFNEQGYKPTLRSLFYRLFSKGLISNNRSTYTSLSRITAKARSEGRLPIDCFEDKSRNILKSYDDTFVTLDQYLERGLNYIRFAPHNYINSIPKWHQQPNYVEVWVEKDAMANSIYSILKNLDIIIVSNKGFTSLTFLDQNIKRLKKIIMNGKKIYIRYFGDLDPSGEYMDTDLENRFMRLGIDKYEVNFQRIAVTKEQIDKYQLPANPDKNTSAKMIKDSRAVEFKRKYGKLYYPT